MVDQYEAYYLDRNNELPLPVDFRAVPTTRNGPYVLRRSENREYRRGLQLSLALEPLAVSRPAFDEHPMAAVQIPPRVGLILVLALLAGGFSLCVTSLVLAWRVVCRKLARMP